MTPTEFKKELERLWNNLIYFDGTINDNGIKIKKPNKKRNVPSQLMINKKQLRQNNIIKGRYSDKNIGRYKWQKYTL